MRLSSCSWWASAVADPDNVLVHQVRDVLGAAGDPERAAGQQRYMRSAMPYHGIATPQLRALLRPVFTGHRLTEREVWEATVRELWDGATHREQWYAALGLAAHRHYRRWQDPDTLALYQHLVVTGAWWDVVDEIATGRVGGVLRTHRQAVTPVVRRWGASDHLWLRRTAILAQLKHKAGTDTALLADVVSANLEGSRHGSEFFIRKAIGWGLREHAKTDPAWVVEFVDAHRDRLSGLSHREALRRLR